MRSPILSAVAALLLGSCAELPAIEPDTCGNGVVEAPEQCDGFGTLGHETVCGRPDDALRACQYVCTDETTKCPAGWGCDANRICRFPTGAYRPPVAAPAGLRDVAVGDVDGDGPRDVVGLTTKGAAVQAWYGQGDGALGARFHASIGEATGTPGYGDLDGDGLLDAVVPQGPGLYVLLARRERVMEPVAYSSIQLPPFRDETQVLPVSLPAAYSAPAMFGRLGRQMILRFIDPTSPERDAPVLQLGPHFVEQLAGRIPRIDLHGGGTDAPAEELALGFLGEPEAVVVAAMVGARLADVVPVRTTTVALPGRLHIDGRTTPIAPGDDDAFERAALRFAEMNGDDRPDLLASVLQGGVQAVAVAFGRGDGTFEPAMLDPRFDAIASPPPAGACPGEHLRGGSPWPLAAGDLDGDGIADFVTGDGVYLSKAIAEGVYTLCRTAKGDFRRAALVDFNRDGRLDIASSPSDVPGVEIRLNDGAGTFSRRFVDTASPPAILRVGDFDGDFVGDVAFVERTDDADDRLSVLFGAVDGAPDAPVEMGRLRAIEYIEPGYTPVGEADLTNDLMVQSSAERGGQGARSIAIMIGTPQRRMLSPFLLRRAGRDGADQQEHAAAVVVGRFHTPDLEDALPDLLAIAWADGDRAPVPNLWLARGRGGAEFNVEDVRVVSPTCAPDFGWRGAAFAAGDLDGDRADELVAVERADAARALVLRLKGSANAAAIECAFVPLPVALAGRPQIALEDLDGDGARDLLVAARGPGGASGGVAVAWNDGGRLGEAVALPIPPSTTVLGAAALNADGDAAPEIAALTTAGTFLLDLTGREATLAASPALPPSRTGVWLQAADTDGDGLTDLVVGGEAQIEVHRAVPSGP